MPEPNPKQPPDRPTLTADQIAAERRRGRIAGIAAMGAVALVLASSVWSQSVDSDDTGNRPTIGRQPAGVAGERALDSAERQLEQASKRTSKKGKSTRDKKANAPTEAEAKKNKDDVEEQKDRVDGLANVNEHNDTFIYVAVLLSLGLTLLAVPFLHIFRATRARRPETIVALGVAAVAGPLALATSTVVRAFGLRDVARDFAALSFPDLQSASDKAEDLAKGGMFEIATALAFAGVIATLFWLVKCNYDALSVGLLPRVIGILGIGLPLVFFVVPPIAIFWLLALGGLSLGLWPGRMPPAWSEGRAIPWPKRQPRGGGPKPPDELGGERNGEVAAADPGVKDAGDDDSVQQPHTQPRKRKRRR